MPLTLNSVRPLSTSASSQTSGAAEGPSQPALPVHPFPLPLLHPKVACLPSPLFSV